MIPTLARRRMARLHAMDGVELSRPLAVLWMLPAIGALLALVVARGAEPRTHANVMTALRFLLFAYLAGVVLITLWPLTVDASVARVEHGNWSPFEGTLGFFFSDNAKQASLGERDVLANVLLYVPLGLLVPYAFFQWRGIPLPIMLLAFLAFALEFTQGFTITERTFDIDDAIAGFAGAVLAVIAAALIHPLTRQIREPAPRVGFRS